MPAVKTPSRPHAPKPYDRERLKKLPQHPDVWQLGFSRFPARVSRDLEQSYQPLVGLCISLETGLLCPAGVLDPEEPTGPAALSAVMELATMRGMRYRPERVEVRDPALAEALGFELAGAGIRVGVSQRLSALDEAFAQLAQELGPG